MADSTFKMNDRFLFHSTTSQDITSSLSSSGAQWTAPSDGIIYVRFYNGFCEVGGNLALVRKNGGWNGGTNSTQPSTIAIYVKKGAICTMWLTGTVVDTIFYPNE